MPALSQLLFKVCSYIGDIIFVMSENENKEKSPVIRETIKDKALNKKKIAAYIAIALICGVLFGVTAAASFHYLSGYLSNGTKEEDTDEAFSVPDEASGDMVSDVTTEEPLPENTDSEAGDEDSDSDGSDSKKELTLEDYQTLTNLLYASGEKTDKSIVSVLSVTSDKDIFDTVYENADSASGLVLDIGEKRVLVLCSYSAVSDASEIRIKFNTDEEATAIIQGYDTATDLCILKVMVSDISEDTAAKIAAADLGSSYAIKRGDTVIAISSRESGDDLIYTGTVTAADGQIYLRDGVYGELSTDIAQSLESGFLTNIDGKVVGVIRSSENGALCAIGISDIKSIIEKISNKEEIVHMGVMINTITNELSKTYDVPAGVLVSKVVEGTAALDAGILQGDIITGMDDDNISTAKDFMNVLKEYTAGDKVKVTIMRLSNDEYKEITLTVKL